MYAKNIRPSATIELHTPGALKFAPDENVSAKWADFFFVDSHASDLPAFNDPIQKLKIH